jgi:hypothetical protein
MRSIFYSVVEINSRVRVPVGSSYAKAEAKLAELQKSNPKGTFRISYKWGSI